MSEKKTNFFHFLKDLNFWRNVYNLEPDPDPFLDFNAPIKTDKALIVLAAKRFAGIRNKKGLKKLSSLKSIKIKLTKIQGYPQRMRIQRRLYKDHIQGIWLLN